MNNRKLFITIFFSILTFFVFGQTQVHASATDNIFGDAWSDNIGWISFNNCTTPTSCSGTDYGVTVDPATGNLSGAAWSDNIGWIDFSQTSGCPISGCTTQPKINQTTGIFTGFARALSHDAGWDGWIALNATDVGQTGWSWKEDLSTGAVSGAAWGDLNLGWIVPYFKIDSTVIANKSIPVVKISASPISGVVNVVHAVLTWSAKNNPTSCSASGDWSGAQATSGNNVDEGVLTSVKTYKYTITCSNANGTSAPATAIVVVNATASNLVPVVSISASPTSGKVGVVNPALTWSATNSPTSCDAYGDWQGHKDVSGTGVKQGILTSIRDYTYIITCSNTYGTSDPAWATVAVNETGPDPSGTLTLSPNSCVIKIGQSTCSVTGASWATTDATSVSLVDRNTGKTLSTQKNHSASPALKVWIAYPSTVFDLKDGTTTLDTAVGTANCSSGNQWNGSICVASPTANLTADQTNITLGKSVTLTWSSTHADICTGDPSDFDTGDATSGTTVVTPAALPMIYTVSCTKGAAQAKDSVTIGEIPKRTPCFSEDKPCGI